MSGVDNTQRQKMEELKAAAEQNGVVGKMTDALANVVIHTSSGKDINALETYNAAMQGMAAPSDFKSFVTVFKRMFDAGK